MFLLHLSFFMQEATYIICHTSFDGEITFQILFSAVFNVFHSLCPHRKWK